MVDKIKEKYLSLSEEDRNKFVDKLKREGKRYGVFPLSSLQDTLLYAYLTDQQDTSYNIRMKLGFSEQLQTEVLKQSLDYVVAANPSLRSKLFILQDTCFQVVEKPYPVQLPVMEGTASYIDNWLKTSDRAFDLQQEYPIRFQLLKDVEEKEYILVLTAHHIFTDGWSFEILVKEIREKYIELCQGATESRTEKKRSYGEIYLDRAKSQTADAYWEKQLKDGIHKVDFESISRKLQITQEDNQTQKDKCKSNQSVSLAKKDLVDNLAMQYGVSPYVLLLSVYLDALHQLSQQESVSTAIAVLNRTTKEELESVGLYATLIPVLSNFKIETVSERLACIKEAVRNAIAYGNVDQRKLINYLMCQDTSEEMYSNVFLFSEQSRQREELGNTGVWMITENIDNSRNIQYDLLCSVNLTENQYVLSVDYRKKVAKELIEELENLYLKVFHEYVDGIRSTIKTLTTEEVSICNREKEAAKADKETEIASENCREEKLENCAERLSAIWENLLGHDAFEPSDNFFAVGGNSLLAIKLLRQMNESFGVNLKITDIFKYHSLSDMSKHLVTLEK